MPPRKKNAAEAAQASAVSMQAEKYFRVRCLGSSPLLMDCFPEDVAIKVLIRREREQPKTDLPLDVMALPKLYVDSDEEPALTKEMVFACLRDAGRYVEYKGRGAKQISTSDKTLLPLLMTLLGGEHVKLINLTPQKSNNGLPWVPNVKVARLPKDKTANAVVRPKFDTWGFEVVISIDTKEVTVDTIKLLFQKAGKVCGLGSMRPSCRNVYGQFVVSAFEEISQAEALAELS